MSEPNGPAPPASTTKAPVAEGEVVAGKYKIERLLGQGGMGVVVAAMHIHLRQRVAIKFLLPDAEKDLVTRFMREARASAKLKSEHVARVMDVAELSEALGRAPYMVMEYLDGSDLSRVLRKRGALPVEDAVDYLLQACEAIAEAHSVGIIHRDLKPANLFLTKAADGSACVKVLDFGISKDTSDPIGDEDEQLTRTTAVLGSPYYMAPEQMRSTRTVDARADIWSIGVILYQLVTKVVPFKAPGFVELALMVVNDEPRKPTEHRPDLPPALEAAILRALRKNPAERFATVAELAAAIAPFGRAGAMTSAERIARTQGAPPPSLERPSGLSLVPPLPAAMSGSGAGTAAGSASGRPSGGNSLGPLSSGPRPEVEGAAVAAPAVSAPRATTVTQAGSGAATQPSARPEMSHVDASEAGREALPPPPAAVAPNARSMAAPPVALVQPGAPSVPPPAALTGAPSIPPPASITGKDAANAATASTWAGAPATSPPARRSFTPVIVAAGVVMGVLAVAGTLLALRGRNGNPVAAAPASSAGPGEAAVMAAAPSGAPAPLITREPPGAPRAPGAPAASDTVEVTAGSAAPALGAPVAVTQTSPGTRAWTRGAPAPPAVITAPAAAAVEPPAPPPQPTPVVVAVPPPAPPPVAPPPQPAPAKKNVLDIDIK